MNISSWGIWKKSERIPEIYGTIIALGLIVYFFVMYAAGLIHVIELRLLNLFIMLGGVYYAIRQYRRTHAGDINYFRALITGTASAAIGVATFSLFLFAFLTLEGNLMQSIQTNEPIGMYLNPYMASFAVFLEGVFSGFGLSYLIVNYVKTNSVNEPVDTSMYMSKEHK